MSEPSGRVLLVEDNPDLADNLAEILGGVGYSVGIAGRCAEAREAARAGFDVALVDLRLPDGDGIQLAPELKGLVPESEVILLTGFATLESAIGAVRAGAWAYLVKPCAPPDLLIAVDQAMRQVRLGREKRDLTRRAQTAEKLAALGVMAAGLAHEIRNPLNAAQLQLQLAERRLRAPAFTAASEVLECLLVVRAEMDRLNRIVEDILDFARPGSLRLEKGDLSHTVETVGRLLAPDAASVGVSLRVVGAAGPVAARYDEGGMKQVLINLVRNGVEAAGQGGEVSIHLRHRGTAVELAVEDTGPGIPEGVDPLVPFFTTKARGTGLGLSTANRIVIEHGGTLSPTRREGRTAFVALIPADGA